MSSITSFIKQVPTASQYFSASGLSSSTLYELIPASGNVVGNYPPGTVWQLALTSAPALPSMTNAVARDMGKTIFAGLGAGTIASPTASVAYGRFRQIQILIPSAISSTQGFIGGSSGNLFGIIGGSDSYTLYATYYIPVVVGGITAVVPADSQAVVAGGQM